MPKSRLVLWFRELGKDDIPLVGGKCANLGELYGKIGVPVPNGFAVTADAFSIFLEKNRASDRIGPMLANVDANDLKALEEISHRIRTYVEGLSMPKEIEHAIVAAYGEICKQRKAKEVAVAVRSSATAEDLPGASFAGQQDTYLNVTGQTLIQKVQRCWGSLFTPRAIFYRKEKGFEHTEVLISVAVQEMIDSKASGVMFTLEPVQGDRNKVVINASWGLGEAIVSGQITPDEYVVEKGTFRILDRKIFKKQKKIVYDRRGGTKWATVPEKFQDAQALSDAAIVRLAQYGIQIENHYGAAQDIEWAIDKEDRMFILQARPETVYQSRTVRKREEKPMEQEILVRGLGVSPGQGSGRAKVLLNAKEISAFGDGEVLVTEMTTPDWVSTMKKASAIVTNDLSCRHREPRTRHPVRRRNGERHKGPSKRGYSDRGRTAGPRL